MKLLRYGEPGHEKPGLLDIDGNIRDLSALVDDIDDIDDIDDAALGADELARLAAIDPESLPLVARSPRLGPCVARIGKFICIGLNYADHAAESGASVPPEPIMFMKPEIAPERSGQRERCILLRDRVESRHAGQHRPYIL